MENPLRYGGAGYLGFGELIIVLIGVIFGRNPQRLLTEEIRHRPDIRIRSVVNVIETEPGLNRL